MPNKYKHDRAIDGEMTRPTAVPGANDLRSVARLRSGSDDASDDAIDQGSPRPQALTTCIIPYNERLGGRLSTGRSTVRRRAQLKYEYYVRTMNETGPSPPNQSLLIFIDTIININTLYW